MEKQKPIIDNELVVAEKFINHLNKKENKNFILPYHPQKDASFDAESYEESNPKEKIRMEIVRSDFNAHKEIGKKGEYTAFRSTEEKVQQIVVAPINHKSRNSKYSPAFKKDNILLIDGWWTLDEDELDFFKDSPSSDAFLKNAGFKEIWFVGMKDSGIIRRLYP